MARKHVIKVPLKDRKQKDDFVLVHAQQEDQSQFIIELDATEGTYAYTTRITHDSVKNLRAKGFTGSNEDIEAALQWKLLRIDPPLKHEEVAVRTEVVVNVMAGKKIVLTIRQRIEDITPDLCIVELPVSEKEIALYDWTGELAVSITDADTSRREAQSQVKVKEAELARLHKQLQDLTEAKKEHESELLEKFRQLLNSKKLKIRDQQRLLAGAKIEASRVETDHRAHGTTGKKSERGRQIPAAKRKVADPKQVENDSSEGFETDDASRLGSRGKEDIGEDQRMMTPESSEHEDSDAASSEKTKSPKKEPEDEMQTSPPPPRKLPFEGMDANQDTSAPAQAVAMDEDETDDEL